jgi:hypothetical protein
MPPVACLRSRDNGHPPHSNRSKDSFAYRMVEEGREVRAKAKESAAEGAGFH